MKRNPTGSISIRYHHNHTIQIQTNPGAAMPKLSRALTCLFFILPATALLTGCQLMTPKQPDNPLSQLPPPLRAPQSQDEQNLTLQASSEPTAQPVNALRITDNPKAPRGPTLAIAETTQQAPPLSGEPISLNLEGVPLGAFINELFGHLLNLSFEIAPAIQNKTDQVTLRVSEPMPPAKLFVLAESLLNRYGVEIVRQPDHYLFQPATTTSGTTIPLIISGSTLPDVPAEHRPIFQFVELKNVRNTDVRSWLGQIFSGQGLEVLENGMRNTIILKGNRAVVAQALEVITLLDQPMMKGQFSSTIEPAYLTVRELTEALNKVLQSQGYGVSTSPPVGSVLLIPLESTRTLLVFTASQQLLEHVHRWAEKLDTPPQNIGSEERDGLYYYAVKNSVAEELAKILGGIDTLPAAGSDKQTAATSGYKLLVDEQRNAILFQGKGSEWAKLLPVLQQMDKPVRQVLVEVTVAEVTLTESEKFGVEWLMTHSGSDVAQSLSTMGAFGISGMGGVSYVMSRAGQTRALLNAFAENQRVNILSTPRVMVKSGSEASIEVGTEVPVVTSQSSASDLTAATGSSASILQNIQYRKTGVMLSVKPTIYSNRQIAMEISQEISSAQSNQTSSVDSPTILSRNVKTSLNLQDGASVLIGGLLSQDSTKGQGGVPTLSDVPLLGWLFGSRGSSTTRTEMLILIVPYVLNTPGELERLTDELRQRFGQSPSP
ncbi:hypothetical protein D5085_10990 [Ectothiorhodospiraceae bacterium BW-2]|nr:hypothetical protein D5085_10990 [Ectothiorhodospiraceae bacterium BW-2]